MDGVDSSEILLIDSQGCPTDASIMGIVTRVNGNAQVLDAPFDAFKFPSSDVVQFRALVTPCVPACEPVTCNLVNPETGLNKEALSYGRRRRSARMTNARNLTSSQPSPANSEEVVLVGAIKITDTFDYKTNDGSLKNKNGGKDARGSRGREAEPVGIFEERIITETTGAAAACTDFMGLIITFIIFLIAQLTLIVAWYYVYRIKMQRQLMTSKLAPASLLPSAYSPAFDHHPHHGHHGHHGHHLMYAASAPAASQSSSASSQASSSASSHQHLQPHHLKFNSLYKM